MPTSDLRRWTCSRCHAVEEAFFVEDLAGNDPQPSDGWTSGLLGSWEFLLCPGCARYAQDALSDTRVEDAAIDADAKASAFRDLHPLTVDLTEYLNREGIACVSGGRDLLFVVQARLRDHAPGSVTAKSRPNVYPEA